MLFITHDFLDAIDIADEIVFLKDGKVLSHHAIKEFAKISESNEIQAMLSELESNANMVLDFLK